MLSGQPRLWGYKKVINIQILDISTKYQIFDILYKSVPSEKQ